MRSGEKGQIMGNDVVKSVLSRYSLLWRHELTHLNHEASENTLSMDEYKGL